MNWYRGRLWAFNEMRPEAPVTSLPFLLKWFGENAFSQKQDKMCRSVCLIRAVLNWICYKLCKKMQIGLEIAFFRTLWIFFKDKLQSYWHTSLGLFLAARHLTFIRKVLSCCLYSVISHVGKDQFELALPILLVSVTLSCHWYSTLKQCEACQYEKELYLISQLI